MAYGYSSESTQRGLSYEYQHDRVYCKTHYYHAPFNFTHFALGDDNTCITGADLRSKYNNNAPSSGDTVDACYKMAAIRFRQQLREW